MILYLSVYLNLYANSHVQILVLGDNAPPQGDSSHSGVLHTVKRRGKLRIGWPIGPWRLLAHSAMGVMGTLDAQSVRLC